MKARIAVRVQPRAKETRLDGRLGDVYKLRLAAPPVDGKANDACLRFLAERLRVPLSAVRLVSGLTSRSKIVEVEGMDHTAVQRALDS